MIAPAYRFPPGPSVTSEPEPGAATVGRPSYPQKLTGWWMSNHPDEIMLLSVDHPPISTDGKYNIIWLTTNTNQDVTMTT